MLGVDPVSETHAVVDGRIDGNDMTAFFTFRDAGGRS